MTNDSATPVAITWQTTLADLLTLLLVFVITERCNLLPNSSSSLTKSSDSKVAIKPAHGTDLAHYNPLERLTYLISCEEGGRESRERLKNDLVTLRDSRVIKRISVLHRGSSLEKCAKLTSQQFDTALQGKVFRGTAAVNSEFVSVLVDVF
jgi:hypothetical protein